MISNVVINKAAECQKVAEVPSEFYTKNGLFNISKNFDISKRKPFQWMLKRFIDFFGSLTGLILTSPLLLVAAILIKLDSKGPVLYKQKRVGLYGKEFYMYKFRSMRQDAEKDEDLVRKQHNEENSVMYKMEDDPRITKIGKFIRKYSIDELPQLLNVLKGEMSLVGPRPRAYRDLNLYDNWHYVFFGAIPGLTGRWQSSGRSQIKNFDIVVKMEYGYITNWSLLLDIYLILKTIPIVITGKNAA